MPDRVIMVSGASPGAGKTTLAADLARHHAQRGVGVRLWSEGELLQFPPFARFDRELGDNNPAAIDSFLAGIRALFADDSAGEHVWITDALLPGFFWLFGRYPPERVEVFSDDLARFLAPWRPLIIHLDGDVAAVFDRAVAERGVPWGERMVAAVRRWDLPHYPDTPILDQADVVRFFGWLNHQTLSLLARQSWETLIIDVTDKTVRDLNEVLLRSLESR